MKKLTSLAILLMLFGYSQAQDQNPCPCCTPVHGQFDFWAGEWEVFNAQGQKVGENSIIKLEKNCILSEHWRSTQGGSGRSYNYYNRQDSTWNQVWIDSFGGHLELKGQGNENTMTLKSKLLKNQQGQDFYNRITWSLQEDQSVLQLWEILNPQDSVINEAFRGIYKKKADIIEVNE